MDAIQLSLDDADLDGRLDLPRAPASSPDSRTRRTVKDVAAERALTEAASAFVRTLSNAAASGRARLLVACCKTKRQAPSPAVELYASPLFARSADLARRLGLPMSILSAKHGLVGSDQILEPYDLTLKGRPIEERRAWAREVADAIGTDVGMQDHLILLAGGTYSGALAPLLEADGRTVSLPLTGMAMGERLAFLNRAHRVLDRRDAAARFYDWTSEATGPRRLSELMDGPLPRRGVYFFFDPDEATSFSRAVPRLVRIGTHGVSSGSKASLRTRLRTHLGTAAGAGNHRSSVFRLHVGEALINRDLDAARYPSWGRGQSADAVVSRAELELERKVSRYMSRLLVTFVAVDDEPGKDSMRAVLERHAIALFTEHMSPLEQASADWLGGHSSQPSIRRSGLWNVRAVGDDANLQTLESIAAGTASGIGRPIDGPTAKGAA